MFEITYFSNKTRKEIFKFFVIVCAALIGWVLQLSVINRIELVSAIPNILFLSCVYFGLHFGIWGGSIYGLVISFLSASILYDHMFPFSYVFIGFFSGIFTKNVFLNEFVFYILLSLVLSFLFEFLSGIQYTFVHPHITITSRFPVIVGYGSALNLFFSPFVYLLLAYIMKRLKIK